MKKNVCRIVLYKWIDSKNRYSISELKNTRSSMLHIFDNSDDILLVNVYLDYESSTKTVFERPEFNKMLRELNKNQIDSVVVDDLSSISNDPFEVSYCIDYLKTEHGIEIFDANVYSNVPFENYENIADTFSVTMPFESSYRMLDTIKFVSLYFDKIELLCPMLDEKTPYFSEKIFNHLNPLINAGIIIPKYVSIFPELSNINSEIIDLAVKVIADDDLSDCDSLMHNHHIHDFLVTTCPDSDPLEKYFMMYTNNEYFQNEFQLVSILKAVYANKNTVGSYKYINQLYNSIAKTTRNKNEGCFAIEATNLLLPTYVNCTFEDILHVRLNSNSELAEMKEYIRKLIVGYDFDSVQSFTEYIERKINKDILDFNKKVREGKLDLICKLSDEFKNPFSYTPIFTSFFCGIPKNIAAALSCGIITLRMAVHYIQMKDKIKSNPLYFRTKL